MIKAVLFDYGGVLTEGGQVGGTHQVFAKLYADFKPTSQFSALLSRLFKGTIDTDEFFAEVNKMFPGNSNPGKEEFLKAGAAPYTRSKPVHELAASLRAAGLRTGVASNVIALSVAEHKKRGDYAAFDPVVLSCEIGAAKPEPEFYDRALKKLNLPANEVLFVDDRESSLVPARKFGMHTIFAESPDQIVRDTRELIESENNTQLPD